MKISRTEKNLLLLATFAIPVFLIGLILSLFTEGVYNLLVPPQTGFAIDDWSQKPTFPIIKIAAFLNLMLSAFFIVRERIVASIITFVLPILAIISVLIFIKHRVGEILSTVNDTETIKFYSETSLFKLFIDSLDTNNIIVLGSITALLFWQFSILLRMLIKNTQRKNVLP